MSRTVQQSPRGRTLTIFDALSAECELDRIADAYAAVYSESPYLESESDFADFRDSWKHRLSAPDFRLAVCERNRKLAGFSFGHGLRPDTKWWSGILGQELDSHFTIETEGKTFAIIELAVLPEYRNAGVGRLLQSQLLAGAAYRRVTLLVRPDAEPAIRFYGRSGYRRVAMVQPYEGAPIYNAMLLEPPIPFVG